MCEDNDRTVRISIENCEERIRQYKNLKYLCQMEIEHWQRWEEKYNTGRVFGGSPEIIINEIRLIEQRIDNNLDNERRMLADLIDSMKEGA